MPVFKPKSTKKFKICKKYTTTLDGKHNEFINEFNKYEFDTIPTLKEEKHNLTKQLEDTTNMNIDQIMDIKDRIKEINKTIKELKNKKTDYFLDNSKYIFEYFENKKNISNIDDSKKKVTSKSQLLFNIFKIKQFTDTDNTLNAEDETKNKNIVQKYFSNIDESFLDMNLYVCETDICQTCRKGEMIPLEDEGVMICNACYTNVPFLIENEKPSYKEPPKEVCFYAYKKINHLLIVFLIKYRICFMTF